MHFAYTSQYNLTNEKRLTDIESRKVFQRMKLKQQNVVLISEAEYNELMRLKRNIEYMHKINMSIKQAEQGKVVIKSMEELEAMADE